MHCPDANCPADMQTNQGSVIEPKTGRTYFLDYPCDLKPGEKVTVVLALHGGGSYGNWQRNYAPFMDYVDKYRLVVATPNTRGWSEADDPYLRNIVDGVLDTVGRKNVKTFWLAGHSMGGFNARRIVCTPYFRDKVDGLLSLSGGRLGNPPNAPQPVFNIPPTNDSDGRTGAFTVTGPGSATAAGAAPPAGTRPPAPGGPGGSGPFSYIFANGEHEPSAQSLATTSSWADKYSCKSRAVTETIADTKPGYIYDGSRQKYGNPAWGRLPRGGTAKVMEYAACRDGRVVADVMRMDKGHTEGLEPRVTEKLIQLMERAKGGKLRASAS
jgi:pimeloyl-ACP methyl ester carboxylesterase